MTDLQLQFRVARKYPFELYGEVSDRAFWYRRRSARWELYQASEGDVRAAELDHALSVDQADHITGPGITWVANGPASDTEDLFTDLARVIRHMGADDLRQLADVDQDDEPHDEMVRSYMSDAPFTVGRHDMLIGPTRAALAHLAGHLPQSSKVRVLGSPDTIGVAGYLRVLRTELSATGADVPTDGEESSGDDV